jgi:uncharacterized protein involved in exopolysaccharide biosynthesis
VAALLWRERKLVLAVGAGVFALGLVLALSQPKSYEAQTRVLVRLGEEYVFEPQVGGVGAGVAPKTEEYISSELKLMGSPEVARRTINQVGLKALYPSLAAAARQRGVEITASLAEKAFTRHFAAATAPNSQVISMSFRHANPQVAAQTLNAMTDQYISYRREILVNPATTAFQDQSAGYNARTAESAKALQAFLLANDVVDFETELKSLTELQARISVEVSEASAKRREYDGQVAALRKRASQEPSEIELYAESDSGKRLIDLQIEREQLLSRYQSTAAPVVEIERRIAQVRAYVDQEKRAGLSRRGPNPVHQDVTQNLFAFEAQARAQAAREAALLAQRAQTAARLRVLQSIEPEYARLSRERVVLEENARAFASRAEQERARRNIASVRTDNVRQMERATPPAEGDSLRLPIAIATTLLAGLLAITAGLGRALLRRGFPTAGSLRRTLDVPVVGVIPKNEKPAAPAATPERVA